MADTKITALTALTAADPANDVIPIVDVSDTTMAASGTTKKISVNNILGASGTATLASATITGDLMVRTNKLKVDSNGVAVGTTTSSTGGGVMCVEHTSNNGLVINSAGGSPTLYLRNTTDSSNAKIMFTDAVNLTFANVSGTLATLTTGGNLGLGVTPSAKFDVVVPGAGSPRVRFDGTSDNPFIEFQRFQGTATNFFGSRVQGMFGGMAFFTSNSAAIGSQTWTQAMTLDASGNLLIGKTVSLFSTVGVEASQTGFLSLTNSASVNATTNLSLYSTGAGAFRFYVGLGGTIYATNTTISAISDARFKENVQDLDVGLSEILALKPRKFDWKAGKGKDIKGDRGFIAQEFETVFPNLIDEWKDPAPEGEAPYKSVRQDLIPVLVKAIQQLTDRVIALENK